MEDIFKIPLLTYELLKRGHPREGSLEFLGENPLRVLARTQAIAFERSGRERSA